MRSIFLLNVKQSIPNFAARAFGSREYLFLLCVDGAPKSHAFVSACFWCVFKKLPVSYTNGRASSLFLLNLK